MYDRKTKIETFFFTVAILFSQLYNSPTGMHWNEVEKNRALGAYFWIHWMSQVPGGILAKRYGTKLVFGLSNFVVCAICFIIPIAAYWDIKALIVLRMIQGFVAVSFLIIHFIPYHSRN